MRSKKLRKEVKENTISFWDQPTSKLEFHSTEEQKIKGGKFRFRQKKLRHRNRYRNSILVSVADIETRFRLYTTHTYVSWFKLVQFSKSRQHPLRAYCHNKYTVDISFFLSYPYSVRNGHILETTYQPSQFINVLEVFWKITDLST